MSRIHASKHHERLGQFDSVVARLGLFDEVLAHNMFLAYVIECIPKKTFDGAVSMLQRRFPVPSVPETPMQDPTNASDATTIIPRGAASSAAEARASDPTEDDDDEED